MLADAAEVPCVPAEVPDGVILLAISQARKSGHVNDFPELRNEIRIASPAPPFRLAIDAVRRSANPIAEELRTIGIPSLHESARGPSA